MSTSTPTPESLRDLVRKWREDARRMRRAVSHPDLALDYAGQRVRLLAKAEDRDDCARELEALLGEETR